jgi:hypothetical protein
LRLLLLLAFAAFAATPAPKPPPAPPVVPDGFVARPTFVTSDGHHYDAGVAFVADAGGAQVLVSALQLLGPSGGLPAQLTAEQVPTTLQQVLLHDAWTGAELPPSGPGLLVAGAHPMAQEGAGDLLLASLPQGFLSGRQIARQALPLAAANPKVGDYVWMVAPVVDGPEKDLRLHAAKVVESSAKWIFFEYTEPGLNLAGTCGAPLLDATGHVVGVNLGGGADKGKLYGSANPVDSVRGMVAAALK